MIGDGSDNHVEKKLTKLQWGGIVIVYLLFPLLLFLFSWDIRWWQAWAFSVLLIAAGVGGRAWAERRHPGILTERAHSLGMSDVMPWDRYLSPPDGFQRGFSPGDRIQPGS